MELSKKTLDNIKKYRPTVHLWSSVRIKFVVIIVTILVVVIISVATSLAIAIIRPYKDLLSNSLLLQTKILLDNLELRVQNHFLNPNKEDLNFLLLNRVTFPEAKYVVVTGKSTLQGNAGLHYVLATDCQDIGKVINTHRYIPGESQFYPEGIEEILQKLTNINNEASIIVQRHIDSLALLTDELKVLEKQWDANARKRKTEIKANIRHLEAKLQADLSALADQGFGSYPDYSMENLSKEQTEYLFYEPVIYYNAENPQESVQGIVFVDVSVENLLEKINDQQNRLIQIIVEISSVVLIAGIFTAWFLSSLFVRPLGILAAHVALIRDTEDKEKLAGKSVQVTSRDEFGMLGTTINDMTEKLAVAAALSKDLRVGKEIQKMFIPLDLSSSGRKLTTGSHRDSYSEFFGYYEGAHGVSGDYFDYRKLDAYHYAVIKCDVAGKGVPAALIMVEVATLFQNYFQNWNYKRDGYNLSNIVMRINDVIESHGFVGRFAAFSLCIINMRVGDAYFCNAGDNIVHIYDKQARRLKSYTLRSGSAAGAFSSEMINLNGGYPVEKIHLNCGDILFLYTDGIEESKRKIRVPVVKSKDDSDIMLVEDNDDNSHRMGTDNEVLGKDRVEEIVEAVFARKKFTLKKQQSDLIYEQMDFDFASCNGTIEDAVLALISVEKVFRMYKDSSAQSFDCVQVDKKIDAFLSKCFLQYDIYCCNKEPHSIYDEYFYYKQIKEDIQYDDLTILGIARRIPV